MGQAKEFGCASITIGGEQLMKHKDMTAECYCKKPRNTHFMSTSFRYITQDE